MFSSGFPKGVILKAFLEKVNWRPGRIFFFDDMCSFAESVAQEMASLHIPCQAFVYQGATVLPARDGCELDLGVARLQHELMEQRDDYVAYAEAREIWECQMVSSSPRPPGKKEKIARMG
jgi:hypothetical protein